MLNFMLRAFYPPPPRKAQRTYRAKSLLQFQEKSGGLGLTERGSGHTSTPEVFAYGGPVGSSGTTSVCPAQSHCSKKAKKTVSLLKYSFGNHQPLLKV